MHLLLQAAKPAAPSQLVCAKPLGQRSELILISHVFIDLTYLILLEST